MNSEQIEIKSKRIKEIIYKKLCKNEQEILTQEDINQITELSLDRSEIDEKIITEELLLLSKLKSLNLRRFNIEKKEIECLNKLPELKILQICDSIVNFQDAKLENNISELDLINCTGITIEDFRHLSSLLTVRIVNCKAANLKGIENILDLKKLYIHNQELNNANELSKAKQLELIDLAGTIIHYDTNLKDISDKIKNYGKEYCLGEEDWNYESKKKNQHTIQSLQLLSEEELKEVHSEDITISTDDIPLLNTEEGKKLLIKIPKQGNKFHLYLNNTSELNEKELELLCETLNIDKIHVKTGWSQSQDRGYDIATYKAIKTEIKRLISRNRP